MHGILNKGYRNYYVKFNYKMVLYWTIDASPSMSYWMVPGSWNGED